MMKHLLITLLLLIIQSIPGQDAVPIENNKVLNDMEEDCLIMDICNQNKDCGCGLICDWASEEVKQCIVDPGGEPSKLLPVG